MPTANRQHKTRRPKSFRRGRAIVHDTPWDRSKPRPKMYNPESRPKEDDRPAKMEVVWKFRKHGVNAEGGRIDIQGANILRVQQADVREISCGTRRGGIYSREYWGKCQGLPLSAKYSEE